MDDRHRGARRYGRARGLYEGPRQGCREVHLTCQGSAPPQPRLPAILEHIIAHASAHNIRELALRTDSCARSPCVVSRLPKKSSNYFKESRDLYLRAAS